jgi:hypothetical protein
MGKVRSLLIVVAFVSAGPTLAMAQFGGQTLGGGIQPLGGGYGTGSNPSSHYVSPYTNSHGTSVQGHYQTNPNSTQYDNYGTRGNVNPHNGNIGTRSPRY